MACARRELTAARSCCGDEKMSALSQSRRAFLARNGRAIALIAGTLMLRATPASARRCPPTSRSPFCCFLRGTAIRAADGWRAVEDLKIGDVIPTRFSGLQPIRWVGRNSIAGDAARRFRGRNAPAVRICASAIAPGVPRVDLIVTASHSFLIDGLLFPAGSLVNGKTITTVEAPAGETLEFFHVRLDRHDVIDAEGAPAETMRTMSKDDPNLEAYAQYYGVEEAEAFPTCAPVGFNGFRSELASRLRSAASPWLDRRRPADLIRDDLDARAWRLAA